MFQGAAQPAVDRAGGPAGADDPAVAFEPDFAGGIAGQVLPLGIAQQRTQMQGRDARVDIDAALAKVPWEFRVAVVLRDLCDLDYAEIARLLDIPPGTVRSRIARGRGQLADLLGNPAAESDRPTTSP